MTAVRTPRRPTLSAEIAAIIRGGLCPRLVRHADGSIELTGLPPDKIVSPDDEAEHLGEMMQRLGGVGSGKIR
jgi:hypothetical protein